MNIRLSEEMETLLIPLYGRARMSQEGYFQDPYAEDAVRSIQYDFSKLHIQKKTQVMLSVRGAQIDAFTAAYLQKHPESTVLYLGCGLDARRQRIGASARMWYDLDFPQVIEIKRQLYSETEQYRLIGSSVTNWQWMDEITRTDTPMLVIAEGLLMYLSEQDVRTLFLKLRDTFQNVIFVFDAYSQTTAKQASKHPSLKKTGASIRWGVDSSAEITSYGSGITHEKTMYLTDENAMIYIPKKFRAMFHIADHFQMAREAHRIFVMKLCSKQGE